ncbi:MAG: hypothetical protein HFF89_08850 [Oscillibacter sp.]|jgi:hypothetical protein|nr:hypothetical protein [Oscillibacter sp.]MCI8690012.1 hypothetical protein [Oscillibacter sp.]
MEEIIPKGQVPELPERIFIHYANEEFNTGEDTEITDLSEAGVKNIVEKVRDGTYWSLFLCPDDCGEEGFLLMERSEDLIFLQISDEMEQITWTCFNPDYLDSDEEAPIECSDGQSIIAMKTTMKDRELAAKCVEWYIHTGEPYPGMDWLKMTW